MLWLLYNVLFTFVYIGLLPTFFMRMARRGGYKDHFVQRFGRFNDEDNARLRETRRVWVHAVSVGEVFVALKFIERWREAHPEETFVLSITSSTGSKIARENADPRDVVIYFPLDFPPIIRRVLRIIEPKAYVMVESEFWPNLIRQLERKNIPIALINGRLSDRSYPRYLKMRTFVHRIMRLIDVCCMQSELDRTRIVALGAPEERVHVLKSAKYEVAARNNAGEAEAQAVLDRVGFTAETTVLMGGSTWPGEERILLEVFKELRGAHPTLRLLLVPRHFERTHEFLPDIDELELSYVRKTELQDGNPDVFILDTTGEMSDYFAHASIIFIGKSLVGHGGQNIIEPALHGKPILVGPHMQNFAQVVSDMLAANAIVQVANAKELEKQVEALLANPSRRMETGAHAVALVQRNAGALTRTVDLLSQVFAAKPGA
jgi:3-deoxy-D-manno-octulosonic-acid transferase